jgi:hypothetical protein
VHQANPLLRGVAAASPKVGEQMYATVRRYEGIDKVRSEEITRKATQTLVPAISELPGFAGYFLIDAGESVFTSVSLFETSGQAHESTRLAAKWVREQDLVSALPNSPKITAGPVIAEARAAATPMNGARTYA